MGEPLSIASPAVNGVNTADVPVLFNAQSLGGFIQYAVNLRVQDNRWRTAYRTRELKPCGDDVAAWKSLFTQNAVWYLPRSGQGNTYSGTGNPRIIESAAGRLFSLEPKNGFFKVTDISGGKTGGANRRIAWLCQAENYMFRTDGGSQTQIYDGQNPIFFSPGYNANAKSLSAFPNAAGPVVYAGGQVWVSVFGREIIVSDSLHEVDQITASDLLKFTDQTYDYINVVFAPPADDGNIVALLTSVNSGYQDSRAQGEVLAMCSGPSIWGVTLGIPRTSWPSTQMRHSRSEEAAATGPNAFFVRDGDILMRTSKGIESVNLMARQINTLGNPSLNLGADMDAILKRDDERSLLFASIVNPPKWDRLFCTVAPVNNNVTGGHYHLGWITANWNPTNVRIPQGFCWEGIGTLPYEMGRPIQFCFARIAGQSRLFALLDKQDGADKGLCEMTLEEGDNILADGSTVPVEWQLVTKRLLGGGVYKTSGWGAAWMWLDNVRSKVTFRVFVRTNVKPQYVELCSKCVEPLQVPDALFSTCEYNASGVVPLGNLFSEYKNVQWIQVMIIGTGVCSVDMAIGADGPQAAEELASQDIPKLDSQSMCQFDPFRFARSPMAVACPK